MTGFDFHPEAREDLDEVWEFISWDSLDAADRVVSEVLSAIRGLLPFPTRGIDALISQTAHYVSSVCAII